MVLPTITEVTNILEFLSSALPAVGTPFLMSLEPGWTLGMCPESINEVPKNGVGLDFSRPHSRFACVGELGFPSSSPRQAVWASLNFPFKGARCLLFGRFPVDHQAVSSFRSVSRRPSRLFALAAGFPSASRTVPVIISNGNYGSQPSLVLRNFSNSLRWRSLHGAFGSFVRFFSTRLHRPFSAMWRRSGTLDLHGAS